MHTVMNQSNCAVAAYPGGRVSEIQIAYKRTFPVAEPIKGSHDLYKLFIDNWNRDIIDYIEQGKALFLDNANRPICIMSLGIGGMRACIIDTRVLFAAALKVAAINIVIVHNHPSCNLLPSAQDIAFTRRVKEAGILLDIRVLDHLIISRDGYYSFADEAQL